jgi:dipeptidyl aminopeptidase/acylaminoacyl peptidase
VELDVPLLRTNAPKREGNRTTILDLDISRMLNSPEGEKLSGATPSPLSVQEMLWAVGDMPGAITPGEREVFLEFEAPPAAVQPPAAPPAQRAAPDTEVYLAPLSTTGDQIEVGQPVNVSNNPGYDNQPAFTRDGTAILFTSARRGTQTDIYRYDIESKRVTQVTATPESEYSPTVTPDGGLSVVRVEADGTQRLWRFTSDGHDPRVLLESIKPVGYHAWADDKTLALYILGQPGTDQPSTLQLASTATGKARTVATDVGRSLAAIPGGHTISFVQRQKAGDQVTLTIMELDPVSGSVLMLTPAVEGATEADCAWTPVGTLLMAKADRVYSWRRGQSGWREVSGSERLGLRSVTRMAVSPDGKWLAIVASPQ